MPVQEVTHNEKGFAVASWVLVEASGVVAAALAGGAARVAA